MTGVQRGAWAVLAAGVAVVFITLGARHSFGLFLEPVTREFGHSRSVFGFAIALQGLFWGFGQPLAGLLADRFGAGFVVFFGGLLYAGGLAGAAFSPDPLLLYASLGVSVGLGLSATSYAVVFSAVGRRFPPEHRTRALGIASLGGSVGMFASVPFTVSLIAYLDGAQALLAVAALAALVCPLAFGLAGRPAPRGPAGTPAASATPAPGLAATLRQAAHHRGYLLLVTGFFVCGFQLAFIGTHLPAYLMDKGLSATLGGTALAVVGASNILGTYVFGALGDRLSKKDMLTGMYIFRGIATLIFVTAPLTPVSLLGYAGAMGLVWLATVPLTSGIVAQVFGATYLGTLVGIVFLMHQVGAFLGAFLGGYAFDVTGSYTPVWWMVIGLSLLAALLHWPIDERPLATVRAVPAS